MAGMSPQPRYRQLAQTLISEIQSGRYPVGGLMPTEMELCAQFGASRFTVREAIKQLVDLGLVSRQAGVGTKVIGDAPRSTYRQVMQELSDLRQYTADTEFEIIDTATITVDGSLCDLLDAETGESWLKLEGLRRPEDRGALPISFTEIYIHPAFRALRDISGRSTLPIYARIEEQFGEQVSEVQQQISAAALSEQLAGRLGVAPDSPALLVRRTYRNKRGEIIEVAVSTHPAERFSYSQTFRRAWRGTNAVDQHDGR